MTTHPDQAEVRRQKIADVTREVAPDLDRAIERLKAFCETQHDPNPPRSARNVPSDYPALYYADVRAVLAALDRQNPTDAEVREMVERLYDGQVCSVAQNSCRNRILMEEAAALLTRLSGQPQPSGDAVKDVARAICKAEGYDPNEDVIGGQASAFENYGPRWEAVNRHRHAIGGTDYVELAHAALAAYRPYIEAEKAEAVRKAVDAETERCAGIAKTGWVAADYNMVGIADADVAMRLCEHIEQAIRARGEVS